MSEFTQYAENCRAGFFADEDPAHCGCRGSGWFLSQLDAWYECPVHHKKGQRHPEDFDDNPVDCAPPEYSNPGMFDGEIERLLGREYVGESDQEPCDEGDGES